MATAPRITVNTTPVEVGHLAPRLDVHNAGSASCFIGGPGVTPADGWELPAGATVNLGEMHQGTWAVCDAATTTTLAVLGGR